MQQKEKRKIITLILSILLILLSVWSAFRIRSRYRENLREKEKAEAWREQKSEEEEPEFGTVHDMIEYQGKTYRRNTSVKAILCMGIDRNTDLLETKQAGEGGQSDGIFLIAQDTARDKVRILAIPRDTMTDIILTDIAGNILGTDVQHLTLAYAYGDGRALSCEYMSRAVTELLGGLKIDGYAAVSMKALGIINDSVGGVTVTIAEEGLADRDSAFRPGETVTLKGDQAEAYLRYRDITKAQTAISRLERQKDYIEKFSQAVKKTAEREEGYITGLLDALSPYLVTDLSKDQYLKMGMTFINSSQILSDEDIMMLPGEGIETDMYDEYIPDIQKTQEMVLELFYRVNE